MSKHKSYDVNHEIQHMLHMTHDMTTPEIEHAYGITIYEDGGMYDPAYDQHFESIASWISYAAENDVVEYEEHFHKHGPVSR